MLALTYVKFAETLIASCSRLLSKIAHYSSFRDQKQIIDFPPSLELVFVERLLCNGHYDMPWGYQCG